MAENIWKSWNTNRTVDFGDFDYPLDKPSFTKIGQPVFGHVYRPYDPFDFDWIDKALKGAFDVYTFTVTWKNDVAEVEIDLPGVKKTGLTVAFEPDHLSITSTRKDVTSVRKVQVDTAALDHEKCEATLEDGVLSLKLVRKTPVRKTLTVK